ncbi:MAG: hypothetical protein ACREA9_22215, partial [Pyrinomonadaceae bacterium]
MKRNSFQFLVSRFQRGLLPFAIVALALSVLFVSRLTPQSRAQQGQKMSPAPAGDSASGAPSIVYPETKKGDTVDDYFGTKVADPYRWLEDDTAVSPDVASWVEAENKVTFAYLEKIPFRAKIKDRLTQLFNYPKYSAPTRRGDYFFYTKNDGLQNQSVWYRQKGLDGTPEVLLDPNKLSADGTTRLGAFSLSKDGKYVAYGVSKGGSDWNDVYVMDVASKQVESEHVEWMKASGVSWQGNGFYYSRYPAPEKGHELTSKNENHQVFYHKVGTSQSADVKVYEDAANPQRFHSVGASDDERYAFLTISERGKGKKGNAVFYRDLSQPGNTFTPIVAEIGDDSYDVVDNVGDRFLVFTDHKAPNGRVFLFDPKNPDEKNWKDV